jgi:hypothetical protein
MKLFLFSLLILSTLISCNESNVSSGTGSNSPAIILPIKPNSFTFDQLKKLILENKFNLGRAFKNATELPIPACIKDDTLEILQNGTFVYTINQPCRLTDNDETGTWRLVFENQKYLISLSSNNRVDELEIINVDDNSFTTVAKEEADLLTNVFIVVKK